MPTNKRWFGRLVGKTQAPIRPVCSRWGHAGCGAGVAPERSKRSLAAVERAPRTSNMRPETSSAARAAATFAVAMATSTPARSFHSL